MTTLLKIWLQPLGPLLILGYLIVTIGFNKFVYPNIDRSAASAIRLVLFLALLASVFIFFQE